MKSSIKPLIDVLQPLTHLNSTSFGSPPSGSIKIQSVIHQAMLNRMSIATSIMIMMIMMTRAVMTKRTKASDMKI